MKPINIELFGCAGGMAEGFRRAGIVFDMVVDKDPDAIASYGANHGHRPIQIDANDLLRMIEHGWRVPIDLFVADPPCTPWSRAGSRKGTADERDCLETTVEIVRALRPRCYLIANVPGLDDGPNWHVVQRLIGGLAKDGYCVVDFERLDAANYGVPQRRIRPFWFGHLDGPCLTWPAPTHGKASNQVTLPSCELLPWVTCREALAHLSMDELGKPVRLRRRACTGKQHGSVGDKPARVVETSNLSDGNVLLSDGNVISTNAKTGVQTLALFGEQPAAKPRTLHNPHPPSSADEPAHMSNPSSANHRVRVSRHGAGAEHDHDADEPARTIVGRRRFERVVMRERTDGSIREHDLDAPAHTLRANRSSTERLLTSHERHPVNELDEPSKTITAHMGSKAGGQGAAVMVFGTTNHPHSTLAEPARTVTTRGDSRGAAAGGGELDLQEMNGHPRHPISDAEEPARTIRAHDGDGPTAKPTMAWPWTSPVTTITADPNGRIGPPGHHGKSFLSSPDAIVLSEKAAAILQGFPETWVFEGKTKRARWSQIGQAMPPPLAHAVATKIVARAEALRCNGLGKKTRTTRKRHAAGATEERIDVRPPNGSGATEGRNDVRPPAGATEGQKRPARRTSPKSARRVEEAT